MAKKFNVKIYVYGNLPFELDYKKIKNGSLLFST